MIDDRSEPRERQAGDDAVSGAEALPPSHLLPRTRAGWLASVVWIALFLVAMPPVTHTLLDRPDTWVAGVPFLFAALLAVYSGLIVILLWALRRGL